MAKYRIGVTEAGDAGLDLSWADRLDMVDGAIVITKQVTPEFQAKVMANERKLIIHATCTGYGGTVVEPMVPTPQQQHDAVMDLASAGFPREKIVIRVDPIIPTNKGLTKAMEVIEMFMDDGFSRFRISVIDMYPHVRARFGAAGLPLPYGEGVFSPNRDQTEMTDGMLQEVREYWANLGKSVCDLRIEACAENRLKNAVSRGCVSALDLALLRLDPRESDSAGNQRPGCMCYSGKTELLRHYQRCGHNCLYCYWR